MSDPLNFQQVACKVYAILTDHPDTRDNDRSLLVHIWGKESQANTSEGLFKEILDGTLSHFESIRRMRQKIQEKHPALRGDKWDVRHSMEGPVCDQLDFFDKW